MTSQGKTPQNLTDIPGTPAINAPKVTKKEIKEIRHNIAPEVYAEGRSADALNVVSGDIINGGGRPSSYTPEIAGELLAGLASGKSLRTVCKDARMPSMTTVFNWMQSKPGFLEQYTQAKAEAADMMAEDILDISDDAQNDYMEITYGDQSVLRTNNENIQRSRLRVETRRWLMTKLQPRKYGDKLDVTSDGKQLPVPLLQGLVEASQNTSDDIKEDENA